MAVQIQWTTHISKPATKEAVVTDKHVISAGRELEIIGNNERLKAEVPQGKVWRVTHKIHIVETDA